ncbi:MAG: helix-turn-helix domain-containing protein [Thermofilaceae archaeon]
MIKIRVLVSHEGCWTEDLNADGVTIAMSFFPNKNYLRSLVFYTRKPKLTQEKGLIRVLAIRRGRGGYAVDFLNKYEGSMAGFFNDMGALILRNKLYRGLEGWELLIYRWALNEIKSKTASVAKILNFSIEEFIPPLTLSNIEKELIKLLIIQGYFENPRKTRLDALSKNLGISKSTLLYHLRNALRKISVTYLQWF